MTLQKTIAREFLFFLSIPLVFSILLNGMWVIKFSWYNDFEGFLKNVFQYLITKNPTIHYSHLYIIIIPSIYFIRAVIWSIKTLRTPLIIILFFIFTSCYTAIPVSQTMDSWLGVTEHEVIMRFGSPTTTSSDGSEGKIVKYTSSQTNTVFTPNTVYGRTATTYDNSVYIEFYINKEGKVYHWRTNHAPGKQLDKGATQGVVVILILIAVSSILLLGGLH